VLVENVFLGSIKERTLRSPGYRAFESHDLCMMLPLLDRALADAIQDGDVSLGDIIRAPLSRSDIAASDGLSFEQRVEMRRWLMRVFRDVHRVTRAARSRAAAPIA
jgi:hypothetical protein